MSIYEFLEQLRIVLIIIPIVSFYIMIGMADSTEIFDVFIYQKIGSSNDPRKSPKFGGSQSYTWVNNPWINYRTKIIEGPNGNTHSINMNSPRKFIGTIFRIIFWPIDLILYFVTMHATPPPPARPPAPEMPFTPFEPKPDKQNGGGDNNPPP